MLKSCDDVLFFRIIIVSLCKAISLPENVTYVDLLIVVDLMTYAIQTDAKRKRKISDDIWDTVSRTDEKQCDLSSDAKENDD